MAATLNDIRAAILAALAPLSRAQGGPVICVGELRGDVSVGTEPGEIEAELDGRANGLLVQLEGDQIEGALDVRTLSRGVAQQTTRSTWRVHVCVSESRSAALEAKGSPGAIGLLPLVDLVRGTLTGLRIGAPVAMLAARVTGTPLAAVVFGAATLAVNGVAYAPTTTGVTLDSFGTATITVRTVTPGALGNQLLGTALTWSAAPAGLDATATVTALSVPGRNALWRAETLRFVDESLRGSRAGEIAVRTLRFSALHVVPNVSTTNPRSQSAALSIDGDVNLTGNGAAGAPNPLAEFSIS